MALREILAEFGVKVDNSGLEKFDQQIEGVKGKLEKLVGIFSGAFVGKEIGEFIKSQIEAGDALVDLADKLGLGTDELQQFQYSAGIFGVQADDAARSLGFLNKNVGEAITGNAEAAKTFRDMHVTLKDANGTVRETADLLPDIAEAFAGMGSQQERTAKAMAIFGRSGAALLPFLKRGKEGVADLKKEFNELGGGLSKNFLEQADKTGDEMHRLDFALKGLKSSLVEQIIPTVLDWTTKTVDLVKGLRQFVNETTFVKTALIGIIGTGVIAAFALLGAETLAIAAAFVVAYLALDDLYALFTGGESVIGDWIDAMAGVGASKQFVADVTAEVTKLWEAFVELKPAGEAILEVMGTIGKSGLSVLFEGAAWWAKELATQLDRIAAVVKLVSGDTGGFKKGIAAAGQKVLNSIPGGATLPGAQGVIDSIKDSGSQDLANRAAGVGIGASTQFTAGGGADGRTPQPVQFGPPVAPGFGKASGGHVEQNNQVSVTVQGGNSPQETGQNVATGVRDALAGQLQDAFGAISAN